VSKQKKTLFSCSAGKYKLNISKKTLKFKNKILVENFLNETSTHISPKEFLLIELSGPVTVRKSILKQLIKFFNDNLLIIKINSLKCFNGCKVKKQRRKKRKKFVIFK
jgi:hypothetical protein